MVSCSVYVCRFKPLSKAVGCACSGLEFVFMLIENNKPNYLNRSKKAILHIMNSYLENIILCTSGLCKC